MTMKLAPCSTCARHIRTTEAQCPFCGSACASNFGIEDEPIATSSGRHRSLSRAALIFMGAAATGAAGCDHESSGPVAVYGPAPVNMDAGTTTTATPPSDAGSNAMPSDGGTSSQIEEPQPTPPHRSNPVPLYGVPPIRQR